MTDLQNIAERLGELTIVEAAELSKILEDKWGVTAAAPVANLQAQQGQAEEKVEEQTEFDVILTSFGSHKIGVIKEVRTITGLGLKEAKELVEGTPAKVKEQVKKEVAEEIKGKIEKAGGKVDIK